MTTALSRFPLRAPPGPRHAQRCPAGSVPCFPPSRRTLWLTVVRRFLLAADGASSGVRKQVCLAGVCLAGVCLGAWLTCFSSTLRMRAPPPRPNGTLSTPLQCLSKHKQRCCSTGPTSTSAAAATPCLSTLEPQAPPPTTAGSSCCSATAVRRPLVLYCAKSASILRWCESSAR